MVAGSAGFAEIEARLYGGPPEAFIAARDAAAASARADGDRALADRIAKLRRPTVSAWFVNLLAHRRADLVAELLDLGEHLRDAQRDLRGDDLRELSQRRRALVMALVREARSIAAGERPGAGTGQVLADVETTLTAALADPDVTEQVRAGTLVKTVSYAGFGATPRPQLRLVQGGQESRAAPKPIEPVSVEPAPIEPVEPVPAEPAPIEPAPIEPAAVEPEPSGPTPAELAAARRTAAVELRRAVADARRELSAAAAAVGEADTQRRLAERAVVVAQQRVAKAQAQVTALEAELAALTG